MTVNIMDNLFISVNPNNEVIEMDNILSELPIGFAMHLAQNIDAMNYFARLDKQRKQEVINQYF